MCFSDESFIYIIIYLHIIIYIQICIYMYMYVHTIIYHHHHYDLVSFIYNIETIVLTSVFSLFRVLTVRFRGLPFQRIAVPNYFPRGSFAISLAHFFFNHYNITERVLSSLIIRMSLYRYGRIVQRIINCKLNARLCEVCLLCLSIFVSVYVCNPSLSRTHTHALSYFSSHSTMCVFISVCTHVSVLCCSSKKQSHYRLYNILSFIHIQKKRFVFSVLSTISERIPLCPDLNLSYKNIYNVFHRSTPVLRAAGRESLYTVTE